MMPWIFSGTTSEMVFTYKEMQDTYAVIPLLLPLSTIYGVFSCLCFSCNIATVPNGVSVELACINSCKLQNKPI